MCLKRDQKELSVQKYHCLPSTLYPLILEDTYQTGSQHHLKSALYLLYRKNQLEDIRVFVCVCVFLVALSNTE